MTLPNPDWADDGITEAEVVIPRQDPIAVYVNNDGDVVIRQAGLMRDDALVAVTPEFARQLCDAILQCADLAAASDPTPAALTNAERQRRYRANKRNEPVTRDRNAAVTQRNGNVIDLPFSPPLDPEEEKEEASTS